MAFPVVLKAFKFQILPFESESSDPKLQISIFLKKKWGFTNAS